MRFTRLKQLFVKANDAATTHNDQAFFHIGTSSEDTIVSDMFFQRSCTSPLLPASKWILRCDTSSFSMADYPQ